MTTLPLELTTLRYNDDGPTLWAPLARPPLCQLDAHTGRALPVYSDAAISAGLTGPEAVAQELTPGMELRLWLAGGGETVTTETPDHTEPFGEGIDYRIQHAPHFVEHTSAPGVRIRTGTRLGWDQPLPFSIDTPPEAPDHMIGSGTDPAKWQRVRAASAWAKTWADVLLRNAPFAPIIMEGVIVGPGFSPASVGSLATGFHFLLIEAFNLARNYWYGWDELHTLGLPVLPALSVDLTSPAAVIAACATTPSRRFPLAAVPLDGLLIRPRTGRGTARAALYRRLL